MEIEFLEPETVGVWNRWFGSYKLTDHPRYRVASIGEHFKTQSFTSQIHNWNLLYGKGKGIFLHGTFKRNLKVVVIVGVTLEQREKEKKDNEEKNKWRDLIHPYYR